jgi:hypothetical protein
MLNSALKKGDFDNLLKQTDADIAKSNSRIGFFLRNLEGRIQSSSTSKKL